MYVCMGGFNFQLSSFNMYDAWFSMIMVIGDSCGEFWIALDFIVSVAVEQSQSFCCKYIFFKLQIDCVN